VSGPVYQFGDFCLDSGEFKLLRNGQALRVERKPMELLLLLASRPGQLVTRAEIAQRLWSSEVFVDTDHGINTAIRKLRHLLRDDPENPQFIETVTGMGYRFIASIATAPAETAPAISPIPEPHAAPGQPESSASPAPPRRLWIVLTASALVLIAILVLTVGPHPFAARILHPNPPAITSIAVLPLDNLSGDPSQDYFADGMTDELITMLAKDSTLRITSRTSVMQYKKARKPLPEIARALNVDAILEGSVSRSANQVHMTLQLIRADSDTHLWADSYDRDSNDVALPNEAAQAIAKRLNRATVTKATDKYVNPAAHDAYLQGKYLWFSDQRMLESESYFLKATQIQPDYAMGWAWLANYYGAATVSDALDPRKSLAPLQAAADRAIQLDPNLAESHQAIGGAYFFNKWDFSAADRELLRAISIDPQYAELYHLRSKLLIILNRNDEAVASEKKAMEINPFERPWGLVHAYACARDYDAAIADGQLRLKAYPTDTTLLATMWDTYRRKGMYKESIETWVRFHQVIGLPKAAEELKRAWQEGGYRGFLRWQIARRTQQARKEYVSPVELAIYHAQLGNRELAFALLEEGYEQHAPDILWIQTDPAFDFLHADPRYRSLVQRIGLPPAY
jgi:TolB-like protein/DNA-binding winged helix-turn-helix (wHTH) protein